MQAVDSSPKNYRSRMHRSKRADKLFWDHRTRRQSLQKVCLTSECRVPSESLGTAPGPPAGLLVCAAPRAPPKYSEAATAADVALASQDSGFPGCRVIASTVLSAVCFRCERKGAPPRATHPSEGDAMPFAKCQHITSRFVVSDITQSV